MVLFKTKTALSEKYSPMLAVEAFFLDSDEMELASSAVREKSGTLVGALWCLLAFRCPEQRKMED